MTRGYLFSMLALASLGATSFAQAQAIVASDSDKVVFSCENFVFPRASGELKVKATVKVAALADGTFIARAILNDRTVTSANIEVLNAEINSEDMNLAALEKTNPGVDASKITSMSVYGDQGTGMISAEIPLSFTVFRDASGAAVAKVVVPQGGGGILAGRCEN